MRAAGRKEGEVAAHAWRGGSKVEEERASGARGGRLRRGPPAARWEKREPVVGEGAGSGGRWPQKGRRVSKVGDGGRGGRLRRGPPAARWEKVLGRMFDITYIP